MTDIVFKPPIPVIRIFDVDKAKAFYCDYLGCAIDWEYRFEANLPLYCQVSRGPIVLHLSEHHGDSTPGARLFIPMHGIEALHAELSEKPYRFLRPGIDTQEWGREIQLTDPFGNRLTFCEQSHG